MKKFFSNVYNWMEVNVIIFLTHLFALFAIAFNDTSEHYDTVVEAIPYMAKGLGLLMIASIIAGIVIRKRENFSMVQYIIMQGITIGFWMLIYISSLVG